MESLFLAASKADAAPRYAHCILSRLGENGVKNQLFFFASLLASKGNCEALKQLRDYYAGGGRSHNPDRARFYDHILSCRQAILANQEMRLDNTSDDFPNLRARKHYARGLLLSLGGQRVGMNATQANLEFFLAGKEGHPRALFYLALYAYMGFGVPLDPRRAHYYFKQAAAKGSVEGIYDLGVFYYHGLAGIHDREKAAACFTEASRLGFERSQSALLYLAGQTSAQEGNLVEPSFEKSLRGYPNLADFANPETPLHLKEGSPWIKLAAAFSAEEAYALLADFYLREDTENFTKDDFEVEWARVIYCFAHAGKNNPKAVEQLYRISDFWLSDYSDPQSELALLKRGADLSLPTLQYIYARQLYRREPPETGLALAYLSKAAQANFAPAEKTLGDIFLAPKSGVFDPEQGRAHLERACVLKDNEALLEMAKLYFEGRYVTKNLDTAFTYAYEGYRQHNSEAQALVGRCYLKGWGCSQNPERAYRLLLPLEKEGIPAAGLGLGEIFHLGIGRPQDLRRAARNYYRVASEDPTGEAAYYFYRLHSEMPELPGDPAPHYRQALKAKFPLALVEEALKKYQEGNAKAAFSLLKTAAEKNDAEALYLLGNFYAHGTGHERDLVSARVCFEKAAELGKKDAAKNAGWLALFGTGERPSLLKAIRFWRKAHLS